MISGGTRYEYNEIRLNTSTTKPYVYDVELRVLTAYHELVGTQMRYDVANKVDVLHYYYLDTRNPDYKSLKRRYKKYITN